MFRKTFADAEFVACKTLPQDTFVLAVLRDPVERFLSGYDESIYRAINSSSPIMPDLIRDGVKGFKDWNVYWKESPIAHDTFYRFVKEVHKPASPWDPHLTPSLC